ncbi:methionyl-tRNA formyltransferase [Polaromonas sp.]|uniref:methionyl-tRNA formyltransferase n=1 Tax=Polaromonas sp. TaxID=1869339 RepID=UPI00286B7D29|nr:methionyl-tRNA formyltransferase [Polaromonas sp.]
MRLIFAGTPEFARVALAQLHAAGHDIALVLTQPDRPAGRGMKLQASSVKQFAQSHNMPVAQPRSLRLEGNYPEDAAAARNAIEATQADAMVVAAYGLILPQWVLDAPRLGGFNIHASLLPRWRGAAPIHRAIEAGDPDTGITIMQMDAGLDTGDMLLTEKLAIGPHATTASLHDALAALGGRLIVQALALAAGGGLQPARQPEAGVSYAHKIDKAEAVVNWGDSAEAIGRRIRAFDPFPGASSLLGGEVIKLWSYEIDSVPRASGVDCGTIVSVNEAGVSVACGQGVLRLTSLQRAGGKRLAVADFLHGFALAPGMTFDR